VGLSVEDGRHINRPFGPARECWERIEEEDGRAAGRARSFIQLESGGWPVHAPFSMRRPLNSGRARPAYLDNNTVCLSTAV
jgi:hypothetical protein